MFLIGCRVAGFVVALALKTISSSIPAYIGHRFESHARTWGMSCAFASQGLSCLPQYGRQHRFLIKLK